MKKTSYKKEAKKSASGKKPYSSGMKTKYAKPSKIRKKASKAGKK